MEMEEGAGSRGAVEGEVAEGGLGETAAVIVNNILMAN